MAVVTTYKNQPVDIILLEDVRDNGWTVSGGYAVHADHNSGNIKNVSIPTVAGETYTLTYIIEDYVSGNVKIICGGTEGATRTEGGTYTEELVAEDNSGVFFWSDGNLKVGILKVAKGTASGVTLAFNERYKRWVSYLSYLPEFLIRIGSNFYSSKDGRIWEHNVNEIRNNFYGQQFHSAVRFIVNPNSDVEKQWFNLRITGKGRWYAPLLKTPSSDLFPNGMQSRLKKNNFKLIDNNLWADILRDMNDPHFNNISDVEERKLKALFNGRELQGKYLEIELRNNETSEVKLSSVDTYFTDVYRTK